MPDGAGRYTGTGQCEEEEEKRRAELYQAIHCSGKNIEMKLRNHQSKMEII